MVSSNLTELPQELCQLRKLQQLPGSEVKHLEQLSAPKEKMSQLGYLDVYFSLNVLIFELGRLVVSCCPIRQLPEDLCFLTWKLRLNLHPALLQCSSALHNPVEFRVTWSSHVLCGWFQFRQFDTPVGLLL